MGDSDDDIDYDELESLLANRQQMQTQVPRDSPTGHPPANAAGVYAAGAMQPHAPGYKPPLPLQQFPRPMIPRPQQHKSLGQQLAPWAVQGSMQGPLQTMQQQAGSLTGTGGVPSTAVHGTQGPAGPTSLPPQPTDVQASAKPIIAASTSMPPPYTAATSSAAPTQPLPTGPTASSTIPEQQPHAQPSQQPPSTAHQGRSSYGGGYSAAPGITGITGSALNPMGQGQGQSQAPHPAYSASQQPPATIAFTSFYNQQQQQQQQQGGLFANANGGGGYRSSQMPPPHQPHQQQPYQNQPYNQQQPHQGTYRQSQQPYQPYQPYQQQQQQQQQQVGELSRRVQALQEQLLFAQQEGEEARRRENHNTERLVTAEARAAEMSLELERARAVAAQMEAELEEERERQRRGQAASPAQAPRDGREHVQRRESMAEDVPRPPPTASPTKHDTHTATPGGSDSRYGQRHGPAAATPGRTVATAAVTAANASAATGAASTPGPGRPAAKGRPAAAATPEPATPVAPAPMHPTGALLMRAVSHLPTRRPPLWQKLWTVCGSSLATLLGLSDVSGSEDREGLGGGVGGIGTPGSPAGVDLPTGLQQPPALGPDHPFQGPLHAGYTRGALAHWHRPGWGESPSTQLPPPALASFRAHLRSLAQAGSPPSAPSLGLGGRPSPRGDAVGTPHQQGLQMGPEQACEAGVLTSALAFLAWAASQSAPRPVGGISGGGLGLGAHPSVKLVYLSHSPIFDTGAAGEDIQMELVDGGEPMQQGAHAHTAHLSAGPAHPMLPAWAAAALHLVRCVLQHAPGAQVLLSPTSTTPTLLGGRSGDVRRRAGWEVAGVRRTMVGSGVQEPVSMAGVGGAGTSGISGSHGSCPTPGQAGAPPAGSTHSAQGACLEMGASCLLPGLVAVMQHVIDAHHTHMEVVAGAAGVLEEAARLLPALTLRQVMQPVLRWCIPSPPAPVSSEEPQPPTCPEEDTPPGLIELLLVTPCPSARLGGVCLLHCLLESPHICAAVSQAATGTQGEGRGSGSHRVGGTTGLREGGGCGEFTTGGSSGGLSPSWAAPLDPQSTQHMLLTLLEVMQTELGAGDGGGGRDGAVLGAGSGAHQQGCAGGEEEEGKRGGTVLPPFLVQALPGSSHAALTGKQPGWRPTSRVGAAAWAAAAERSSSSSSSSVWGPFELHRRVLALFALLLERRRSELLAVLCAAPWLYRTPGLAQRLLAVADMAATVSGWPLEAVQPPVALLPAGAAMPMSTHTLGAWAQRVRLAAEALLLLREILKGSDELCLAALDDLVLEQDAHQATCLSCSKLSEWKLPASILAACASPMPAALEVAPWAQRAAAAILGASSASTQSAAGLALAPKARASTELVESLTKSVQRRAAQRIRLVMEERRRRREWADADTAQTGAME